MTQYNKPETNFIYLQDTWPVSVLTTKRLPAAPLEEVDATPSSAVVTVYSERKKANLDLGGLDDPEGTATVTGNVVSYSVPGSHHDHTGQFHLFMTITFDDSNVSTYEETYEVRSKK